MKMPMLDIFAERTKGFFLILLSLLFVCVIFWIIISLFSSQKTSKVPETSQKLATPLNPVLDTSKLNKLEEKTYYAPEELRSFPINVIETDAKSRTKRVIQIQPS